MRLLHVINSLVVGGAERLLKDTVNGIAAARPDIEQHVVTLYEEGQLRKEIDPAVRFHCLQASLFSLPAKTLSLRSYIRKNKISVVHAHLYDAMIISRLACPGHVKFVNTYHNGMYNPGSVEYSYKRKLVDKLTARSRHHSVFVSEVVKHDVCRRIALSGPLSVVPNFPSPDFRPSYVSRPGDALRLVSVGTLRHPKNHEYSIAVMSELKGVPVTLDIYGYGPREKSMRSTIEKNGAAIRIISDKVVTPEILSGYDAYFMPSLNEGMSIAVLEAMTCGLPLVLSDIPSFRETARDAALYFRLNSISPAVNTILHLHKNRELLSDLSRNSLGLSSHYGLSNNIHSLLAIYKN